MTISIIIPTWNEAENIGPLIRHLQQYADDRLFEIIVSDGGSTDDTLDIVRRTGATALRSPQAGRACQMNYGAAQSKGEILYFVHADTQPPGSYLDDILKAVGEGHPMGSYQSCFDTTHPLLRINAWFTRFDFAWCRGGDQSIFITRRLFEELDGYREDYRIMEEYDLIRRARKSHPFRILPKATLISARKYEENSYFRVQVANLIVFNMFRLGFSQERMVRTYSRLLKYR